MVEYLNHIQRFGFKNCREILKHWLQNFYTILREIFWYTKNQFFLLLSGDIHYTIVTDVSESMFLVGVVLSASNLLIILIIVLLCTRSYRRSRARQKEAENLASKGKSSFIQHLMSQKDRGTMRRFTSLWAKFGYASSTSSGDSVCDHSDTASRVSDISLP